MSYRVLAVDFDETITRINTTSLEPDPTNWVDLDFFKRLVFQHSDPMGAAAIAIVSFNQYDVIAAHMHSVFPARVFGPHNIYTSRLIGYPDGTVPQRDKIDLLGLVAMNYGVGKHEVVFVDDKRTNVDMALSAGYVNSFHVPQGLTSTEWIRVLNSMRSPRTIPFRPRRAYPSFDEFEPIRASRYGGFPGVWTPSNSMVLRDSDVVPELVLETMHSIRDAIIHLNSVTYSPTMVIIYDVTTRYYTLITAFQTATRWSMYAASRLSLANRGLSIHLARYNVWSTDSYNRLYIRMTAAAAQYSKYSYTTDTRVKIIPDEIAEIAKSLDAIAHFQYIHCSA